MTHLFQFWFSKLSNRIMFGRLSFPGTRWYVVTVRDARTVRNQ